MKNNKITGNYGEAIAARFLEEKGYKLLHKNWRYKRCEVDIICCKNDVLHFMEVKTRSNNLFGNPEESITQHKMNMLKTAADAYLQENSAYKKIQFDVVSITLNKEAIKEILLIEDVYF